MHRKTKDCVEWVASQNVDVKQGFSTKAYRKVEHMQNSVRGMYIGLAARLDK